MTQGLANKILSDITVHMKYAKYLPTKDRRETWKELVSRNKKMHTKKFPELREQINNAYKFVYGKKVLPSMLSPIRCRLVRFVDGLTISGSFSI